MVTTGHAGENGRRKVGEGKKGSRRGDGGQSGNEESIPEEQPEEPLAECSGERSEERSEERPFPAVKDNRAPRERGSGKGGDRRRGEGEEEKIAVRGRGSSSSSKEGRKASAGRGGFSPGRGSTRGGGRGGTSARRGGNASGSSSPARTGGVGADGCTLGGEGRGGGGGGEGEDLLFEPLSSLHAVVFSFARARESLNNFPNLEPDFVALYDPDAAFVGTLEAYQAGRPLDRPPLVVYFMLYEQSEEEQS